MTCFFCGLGLVDRTPRKVTTTKPVTIHNEGFVKCTQDPTPTMQTNITSKQSDPYLPPMQSLSKIDPKPGAPVGTNSGTEYFKVFIQKDRGTCIQQLCIASIDEYVCSTSWPELYLDPSLSIQCGENRSYSITRSIPRARDAFSIYQDQPRLVGIMVFVRSLISSSTSFCHRIQ